MFLTPYEFVNLVLENKENAILSKILNDDIINYLELAQNIMQSTNNNTKYTYQELSKLINTDESLLKQIYTLYHVMNTTTKLTPSEFAKFLLAHQNDTILKDSLDKESLSKLEPVSYTHLTLPTICSV